MRKTAREYFQRAHELDPGNAAITRDWLKTLPAGPERVAALEAFLKEVPSAAAATSRSLQAELAVEKELGSRKRFALASPYAATQIDLEPLLTDLNHYRGYGLKVRFNDSKPEQLLVDTGASGITINRHLAEEIGAKRLADVVVQGIGDQAPIAGYSALVDKVSIGDVVFRNCVVVVADRKSVAGEAGLIGTDVFGQFLVTLDFSRHTLRLEPLPQEDAGADWEQQDRLRPAAFKDFTPVFQFSHHLLIPTAVGKLPPVLFLIDSGANTALISAELAREVTRLDEEANLTVKGASGRVNTVYTTYGFEITFSHFRRRYRGMISFDFSRLNREFGTDLSGVLGLTVLNLFAVKIDYRDGLVDFQYHQP